MPEVGAKMPSQITNNNAVYSKFCAISNKKKVICTRRLPTVFFSLLAYFKTNETKRSLGNVVHLFLRLSVLLHQVSKKQRRTLRRMKKNGVAPNATAKQKRRNFENS